VGVEAVVAITQKSADDEIKACIAELLQLVGRLSAAYPKKKFTLDGRLVGDIGEALAEREYDLEVFAGQEPHHDARAGDGRLVQIKATMKEKLSFPADHVPDYYLGIRIKLDGSIEEIFNGPGSVVGKAVADRVCTKNSLHMITLGALKTLNSQVPGGQRIPKREQQLS
jgi:hypothetical protein